MWSITQIQNVLKWKNEVPENVNAWELSTFVHYFSKSTWVTIRHRCVYVLGTIPVHGPCWTLLVVRLEPPLLWLNLHLCVGGQVLFPPFRCFSPHAEIIESGCIVSKFNHISNTTLYLFSSWIKWCTSEAHFVTAMVHLWRLDMWGKKNQIKWKRYPHKSLSTGWFSCIYCCCDFPQQNLQKNYAHKQMRILPSLFTH